MFHDDNLLFMMEYSTRCRLSAKLTAIQLRVRKVMNSCVKEEQLNNAYKWALQVTTNLYNEAASRLFGNPLENDYINVLECIKETYQRKIAEIADEKLSRGDALFIQEIINDLERNGYQGGAKRKQCFSTGAGSLERKPD
ncbi:hypothetical protein LJB84_03215 [Bacteroidales bacterium OttesenSCG-928-J19]|nr:hypothetical protein [Bacteroidales bacterium OttesenSCG-928-J19]